MKTNIGDLLFVMHSDRSPQLVVIVRLDRTIQCALDSPIKSGNDGVFFLSLTLEAQLLTHDEIYL